MLLHLPPVVPRHPDSEPHACADLRNLRLHPKGIQVGFPRPDHLRREVARLILGDFDSTSLSSVRTFRESLRMSCSVNGCRFGCSRCSSNKRNKNLPSSSSNLLSDPGRTLSNVTDACRIPSLSSACSRLLHRESDGELRFQHDDRMNSEPHGVRIGVGEHRLESSYTSDSTRSAPHQRDNRVR